MATEFGVIRGELLHLIDRLRVDLGLDPMSIRNTLEVNCCVYFSLSSSLVDVIHQLVSSFPFANLQLLSQELTSTVTSVVDIRSRSKI